MHPHTYRDQSLQLVEEACSLVLPSYTLFASIYSEAARGLTDFTLKSDNKPVFVVGTAI